MLAEDSCIDEAYRSHEPVDDDTRNGFNLMGEIGEGGREGGREEGRKGGREGLDMALAHCEIMFFTVL